MPPNQPIHREKFSRFVIAWTHLSLRNFFRPNSWITFAPSSGRCRRRPKSRPPRWPPSPPPPRERVASAVSASVSYERKKNYETFKSKWLNSSRSSNKKVVLDRWGLEGIWFFIVPGEKTSLYELLMGTSIWGQDIRTRKAKRSLPLTNADHWRIL